MLNPLTVTHFVLTELIHRRADIIGNRTSYLFNLTVLVIEGGPNNRHNPLIVHPTFFFANLAPSTKTIAFHTSKKSEFLANRELVVPTASVLGGGSSLKVETYHGPGSKELHGSDDPVIVSSGTYRAARIEDDFLAALKAVGYPEIEDLGDLDSCNGAMRAMRFVDPGGLRQGAAHSYLHPRLERGKHPNLHVLVEAKIERALLDNKHATGVVYRPGLAESEPRAVKARRVVVVSGGVFGTPAVLLERSGIGNPQILKQAGVEPIIELPRLGDGYQDHHLQGYPYKSSLNPDETHDAINGGRFDIENPETRKLLGCNAADISCKLRPTKNDVAALGSEFQKVWEKEWKHNENKPMASSYPGVPIGLPVTQYFGHNIFSPYPASRGHVHITGPGLDDKLDFDAGFFGGAGGIDVKKLYRGEVPQGHPSFAANSSPACIETVEALPENIPNIEYTPKDDATIDQWLPSKVADLSTAPGNIGAHTANTAYVIGEKVADIIIHELSHVKGLYYCFI
ncbi:alcohol oxidase-like protein [Nemania diffusa]|nr:alcohol oxidase-like protein [Nemania diffusa]